MNENVTYMEDLVTFESQGPINSGITRKLCQELGSYFYGSCTVQHIENG